jgi:hypothetical protein
MAGLLAAAALAALAGCAGLGVPPPSAATNRPDGEGYAGVGELLVRIGTQQDGSGLMDSLMPRKRERAVVEIRYQGLDGAGRAVFERHDADALSESAPGSTLPTSAKGTILVPAAAAAEPGTLTPAMPPNTRDIALDLRLGRQLRVQGKIIEVIEATASGVVFRLY